MGDFDKPYNDFLAGVLWAKSNTCSIKNTEWSKDDINNIIERLKIAYKETKNEMFLEDIEQLKSLRPQPKEEWSEKDKDSVAAYLHEKDGGMLWNKAEEMASEILDILYP